MIGRFRGTGGYATSIRRWFRLLEANKFNVMGIDLDSRSCALRPGSHVRPFEVGEELVIELERSPAPPVVIVHERPDRFPLISVEGEMLMTGYSFWEFDSYPDPWVDLLLSLDHVIAPSSFNLRGLSNSGVPASVISQLPMPKTSSNPVVQIGRRDPESGLPFRIGTLLSGLERKDPAPLIRSFLQILDEFPNLQLHLKVANKSNLVRRVRDTVDSVLRQSGHSRPISRGSIQVDSRQLSDSGMDAWLKSLHLYVSVEVASGWNIPVFDCLALGVPVASLIVGAMDEYCGADDLVGVPDSKTWAACPESSGHALYQDQVTPVIGWESLAAIIDLTVRNYGDFRDLSRRKCDSMDDRFGPQTMASEFESFLRERQPFESLAGGSPVLRLSGMPLW
jgi:hypothetical protein